jgi:hypothetical protein
MLAIGGAEKSAPPTEDTIVLQGPRAHGPIVAESAKMGHLLIPVGRFRHIEDAADTR